MMLMLMMFMKMMMIRIMKTAGNITIVIKILMRKMRLVTVMMRGTVTAMSGFSCDVDYINGNDDDVTMMMVVAFIRRRNRIEVYCPTREGNVSLSHQ